MSMGATATANIILTGAVRGKGIRIDVTTKGIKEKTRVKGGKKQPSHCLVDALYKMPYAGWMKGRVPENNMRK